MRYIFLLTFLLTSILAEKGLAQLELVELKQIDSVMKSNPKKILVLLTADYCKYCSMQKSILSKYLGKKAQDSTSYLVILDIESSDTFLFGGRYYSNSSFSRNYRSHKLAITLAGSENITLPALIVLNQNFRKVFQFDGLMTKQKLNTLFKILGKDNWLKQNL